MLASRPKLSWWCYLKAVTTVVEKDSKPLQHSQLGTDRLVQAERQQYRPIVAVGYAEAASYKPRRV